jgi:DNA replication protein DnaC
MMMITIKEMAMSKTDYESQISSLATSLGLYVIANYKKVIDPNVVSFDENLTTLLKAQYEETYQHKVKRKAKSAGITVIKTLDMLDFSDTYLPRIKHDDIKYLESCGFIDEKQNVVAVGQPGKGKTHLAIAIGFEAIKKNYSVKFKNASTMIDEMWEAKSEKKLTAYVKSILRYKLLIIDELGYISYDSERADLLFKIISARNENSSTFITTNYLFSDWEKFIKDKTLASAMISRFADNSVLLNMTGGKDYRLEKAKIKNKS